MNIERHRDPDKEYVRFDAGVVAGKDISYPDPTEADLKDPDFEAVWDAIKKWDISRYGDERSYAGATGNDVMHILLALKHSASQLPELQQLRQQLAKTQTLLSIATGSLEQVEADKARMDWLDMKYCSNYSDKQSLREAIDEAMK